MKRIILKIFLFVFGLSFLGGLVGLGVIVYFSYDLPKIATLADYNPPLVSQIISADGQVLAQIGKEEREIVTVDEVPQVIVDAFLSAEDAGFYEHSGVDYLGVMRALVANLKAGRVVQGGSTITQQVAKSLLLTSERSIARKIKDFLLALRIEKQFTKNEILFLYLNQVYLGGGYYGVKSAIRGYFDKDLEQATPAESAMIAGLLVAPGRFSPYINPSAAKNRQVYVLGRMLANNKITQEQYNEAIGEDIRYRIRRPREFLGGHYTDWIRQRVIARVGEEEFLTGGYRVQTTLDWDLQQVAEREILLGAKEMDKRQGFKGPLRTIESEKIIEFEQGFRKTFYEQNSSFFQLDEELKRIYELNYDPSVVNNIEQARVDWRTANPRLRVRPGYSSEDPMIELLKPETFYEAVVTYVDDWSRMIYVSIGGVAGIIPYNHFRWAHERVISEDRQFFPFVTRPSTIVKRGDIVHVTIANKETGLYRHLQDETKAQVDKMSEKEFVLKQRYLLCWLDQVPDVQAALLSIDQTNGHIISFVGGVNFRESQFNRVIQSRRQPGSSFKALLFAAALENGFTPATIILDSPESLGGVDESLNWKPRNYDGQFKGPMTFRNSLEQSRNIPTIKIAESVGVPTTIDFMNRIGFNAKIDRDLSLALGSFGVSLLDIVSTYAVFPNGGRLLRPKSILSIQDRSGNLLSLEEKDIVTTAEEEVTAENEIVAVEKMEEVLEDSGEEKEINPFHVALGGDQVYDPRLAYIMTNLLKGAVHHGTGRAALEVSRTLAGKTGTTNNYVDAWFIGFSPNLVTGVWTGFDDNKTLGFGETGARSALPIWKEYMRASLRKYGESDFRTPIGIVNVRIDKETGRPAQASASRAFEEAFVEGTEPGSTSAIESQKPANSTQIFGDDDYYENQ